MLSLPDEVVPFSVRALDSRLRHVVFADDSIAQLLGTFSYFIEGIQCQEKSIGHQLFEGAFVGAHRELLGLLSDPVGVQALEERSRAFWSLWVLKENLRGDRLGLLVLSVGGRVFAPLEPLPGLHLPYMTADCYRCRVLLATYDYAVEFCALVVSGTQTAPSCMIGAVLSDAPGVLIFAVGPDGKPNVVVLPDDMLADIVVSHLQEEGWTIQEPTFEVEIDFDDEDDGEMSDEAEEA